MTMTESIFWERKLSSLPLKEIITLCYKELNLFIVNLQYVFSQHNKH